MVSPAPSRVPGTEQVLHTYCWMDVSDPSLVNTDSKMHCYGCPPQAARTCSRFLCTLAQTGLWLSMPVCSSILTQTHRHTHIHTDI